MVKAKKKVRPDAEVQMVVKSIEAIQTNASRDADAVLAYAEDLLGPRSGKENRGLPFFERAHWEKLTLARMYYCSFLPEAGESPALALLAMRYVFDPKCAITGTLQRFHRSKSESGWTIREFSSLEHTLLARAPTRVAEVKVKWRVAILDCVLKHPRDLSTLRKLIVVFCDGVPPAPKEVFDPAARPVLSENVEYPLNPRQVATWEIIADQGPGRGIKGTLLRDKLEAQGFRVGQSTLTTHIMPSLIEHYGVRRSHKIGYHIEPSLPLMPKASTLKLEKKA